MDTFNSYRANIYTILCIQMKKIYIRKEFHSKQTISLPELHSLHESISAQTRQTSDMKATEARPHKQSDYFLQVNM